MSSPTWRQMFNAWEKAVAPGLEEMTASNGFRDIMATLTRANANVAEEIERMSRQWLHMWNLPAATDVRKLRRQVSSLERELKAIRRELDQRNAEARTTGGAKSKTNGTSTGRDLDLVGTEPSTN